MEIAGNKKIDPLKLYYTKEYYKDISAHEVIGFPKILLLQASSYCNFTCIMCRRRNHLPEREKTGLGEGNMSLRLVEKLVDECRGEKGFLGFHFAEYGEPLMNPEMMSIISSISKAGLNSQIVTNGYYLDDEMCRSLIEAGLSKIKISFQGATPEKYRFWRNNDHYDHVVRNVLNLVRIRDESRSRLFVQVGTSSCDDTEEDLYKFIEFWKDIVDHVYWNYTALLHIKDNSVIDSLKILRQAPKKTERCNDPFLRMTIVWNGMVTQCVSDEENFIGNLNKQTIKDIWNSREMNKNRKVILEKGNCLTHCEYCTSQPEETRSYTYRYE